MVEQEETFGGDRSVGYLDCGDFSQVYTYVKTYIHMTKHMSKQFNTLNMKFILMISEKAVFKNMNGFNMILIDI